MPFFLVAACWLLVHRYPQAAVTTGTAGIRGDTAFSIFCWLEVRQFDLFFLVFFFLFLGFALHVISFLSLMYCVKFLDPLRGKCGFLQKATSKVFARRRRERRFWQRRSHRRSCQLRLQSA